MRQVILTVGPRHAGKTTFCQRARKDFPDLGYISRDEILDELFGTTMPCSYFGGHRDALRMMWKRVRDMLHDTSDARMILDAWNGTSRERQQMVQFLRRHLQVDEVIAWYFITPLKRCIVNELIRDPIVDAHDLEFVLEMRRMVVTEGCKFYHQQCQTLEQDGFDRIYRIDPLSDSPSLFLQRPWEQLVLPGVELLAPLDPHT